MRPQSIILFERIALATIALGIVAAVLSWQRTVGMVEKMGHGPGLVIGIQAVSVAFMLLLVYFITRRASEIAKWIFVVLVVLGAVNMVMTLSSVLAAGPAGMIAPAQLILQLIATWMLFRPDAGAWFRKDAND
ncbi:hypothetical protein ACFB49_18020 [Sphingomonas sp. DBB INV C78]|uniref:hypothetical protein n=1 Tax=Sphingomonas sp. DBB INV C78 TaxID=3349434 RepID=UPI0036D2AB30